MDDLVIDTHLENIDRRLTKLEQILPTLATKSEMQELDGTWMSSAKRCGPTSGFSRSMSLRAYPGLGTTDTF